MRFTIDFNGMGLGEKPTFNIKNESNDDNMGDLIISIFVEKQLTELFQYLSKAKEEADKEYRERSMPLTDIATDGHERPSMEKEPDNKELLASLSNGDDALAKLLSMMK